MTVSPSQNATSPDPTQIFQALDKLDVRISKELQAAKKALDKGEKAKEIDKLGQNIDHIRSIYPEIEPLLALFLRSLPQITLESSDSGSISLPVSITNVLLQKFYTSTPTQKLDISLKSLQIIDAFFQKKPISEDEIWENIYEVITLIDYLQIDDLNLFVYDIVENRKATLSISERQSLLEHTKSYHNLLINTSLLPTQENVQVLGSWVQIVVRNEKDIACFESLLSFESSYNTGKVSLAVSGNKAPLGKLRECFAKHGFPERIVLSNCTLTENALRDFFTPQKPIQSSRLTSIKIDGIACEFDFHNGFSSHMNIQELIIEKASLTDKKVLSLAHTAEKLPNLRILSLADNNISLAGLSLLLQQTPALEKLNIKNNKISGNIFDPTVLTPKFLTELDLSGNNLEGFGRFFASQTTLEIVNLSKCTLLESDLQALFEALRQNPLIHDLDLSHIDITKSVVQKLCSYLREGKTLQRLILINTKLSDDDGKQIAEALETNNSLFDLDVSETAVADSTAIALSKVLKKNNHIQILGLRNTKISSSGAKSLIETIKELPRFSYCDLSYCDEIPDEMQELIEGIDTVTL